MKAGLAAAAAAVGVTVIPAVVPAVGHTGPRAAANEVSISFVHGLPDVAVDVLIGGTVVIDSFEPGSIADITALRGRTLEPVSIVDDASGDLVLGPIPDLDVAATGSWSIVAHLDGDGEPTISSFENDRSPVDAGRARLTFRHTAHAPALDLVLGDQRPVANAVNGDTATIELPQGTLADARIAPTGQPPILDLTPVDLAPATDSVIHVIGALDDLDAVVQVIDLPRAATTTPASDDSSTVPSTVSTPTGTTAGSQGDGIGAGLLLASFTGLVIIGGALALRRRA